MSINTCKVLLGVSCTTLGTLLAVNYANTKLYEKNLAEAQREYLREQWRKLCTWE